MAEHRPFPPSARRRALARAAGLHAASPLLVAAGALGAVALAIAAAARAASRALGTWIADACQAPASLALTNTLPPTGVVPAHAPAAGFDGIAHATSLDGIAHAASLDGIAHATSLDGVAYATSHGDGFVMHAQTRAGELAQTVLALALPVLAAAALAAIVVHVAQTRAVWMPRRAVPGAPALPPERARRSAFELATAFVLGGVTLGWLWAMAPRLAALIVHPLAGGLVVEAFLASLAIAYVALGATDALLRHATHAAALRMTHADHREDARLASADPRWRKARADAARTRSPRATDDRARDAIAGASFVLLGEDTTAARGAALAIAIAWDPQRRPVPARTAVGRGARATQLLGLARRYALPVHRDAALAVALAAAEGPVPETHWPRLAEIAAATSDRGKVI